MAEAVGARLVSKEDLFRQSDFLSVHLVLSSRTRGIVDKAELALMKPSSYLINTSRGPLIDEQALADALRTRRIRGAGLDVFENEPHVHPDLLPLDNVLLVPHLASATTETRTSMADLAVENVLAVLAGHPPLTAIPA